MKKPEEIHVLNKRVRLLQPIDGFRTSLDSVMLAAACPAKKGETVLDMGCGVGGAGLCVLERVVRAHLTGVEIQDDHVELARANAALNGVEDRVEFICANIKNYKGPRFHHVICNPPYLEAGAHTVSPSSRKAKAHGHSDKNMSVEMWLNAGFHHLKSGGSLTMIHRADQTDKIILGLGKRFGAIEIFPLWPRLGIAAKRVIIRARKDRKSPATLHAGLVLHKANGDYTDAADDILRRGKALG